MQLLVLIALKQFCAVILFVQYPSKTMVKSYLFANIDILSILFG